MVIETLTGVDPSRKCFRMIGGVLVERTVREVLPALTNNRDQVRWLRSPVVTNYLREMGHILLATFISRNWLRQYQVAFLYLTYFFLRF